MALSELEELELLELEEAEAGGGVRDSFAQPSGNTPPPNTNFEVSGRYPVPGATPSYAPPSTVDERPGFSGTRALLTNEPTQGLGEDIVRGIPATIGGLAGGAAGLAGGAAAAIPSLGLSIPAGAAASIGLAGLGGAAGESARQGMAQAYSGMTGRPFTPPGQVFSNIGAQGVMQAGGQAAGLGIGAAASAVRPFANKLGAQVARVTAAIPEKAGLPALSNPSRLLNAPSTEASSAAYGAFEKANGLTGLNEQIELLGKAASESDLEKHLFEVAARTRNGVPSTPQELYHASQAASQLNMMGKLGNPRYAGLKMAISKAKGAVDDALETALPGYRDLRTGYADSKMAEQFSGILPRNQNQSPNVLRSYTAGAAGAAGLYSAATGDERGLGVAGVLALPLVSPAVWGTAIKGAAIVGKVPNVVYRVGTQAGASTLAQKYGELSNRRIPVPDPAFQSIGGVRSGLP